MPTVDSYKKANKIIMHLVEVHKRAFLIDLWRQLVIESPEVTGKMRNSWKISPVKPTTVEIPEGTYGFPDTPNLDRYKVNYTKWFVTNTAPYTALVNYQTAKQVPKLFIERARDKVLSKYG